MTSTLSRLFIVSLLAISFSAVKQANADTIYQCRAYNGESFWSSAHCHTHKALLEGIYTVPDNMPFQQQVDLAQRGVTRANSARATDIDEQVRSAKCDSLRRELNQLQSKYTNWQYVPIDQVNADQARERDLRARRSALHCYQ